MERKIIHFSSAARSSCFPKPCEENVVSIVNTLDEYGVPVKDVYIKDRVKGVIERKSCYSGPGDRPKEYAGYR